MANEIKALETIFDGRRFRSRAEGRWAVVFKTLGWDYDYEREGFDLDGARYLPDFFLPGFPMWWEVKGEEPNERELLVAHRLAAATGQRVVIAIGPGAGA